MTIQSKGISICPLCGIYWLPSLALWWQCCPLASVVPRDSTHLMKILNNCFFQSTTTTLIFLPEYSFHSQFTLHLCRTLMCSLLAITIKFSYKASQQRKLFVRELAGWFWRLHREMAGKRDDGRARRLQRRTIHVSRRGHTWVESHCGNDLPVTIQLTQSSCLAETGSSWSHPACQLFMLSHSAAIHSTGVYHDGTFRRIYWKVLHPITLTEILLIWQIR